MTTIARNQVYSGLASLSGSEVEHTGIFHQTPCNASYRAAIYQTSAFEALAQELESNVDKQRAYSALNEAATSCDAASFDLVQPCANGTNNNRSAVYSANLAQMCTNATAVHNTQPVSAEKAVVYENLYELVNFEMGSKAQSSPRAGVYAANAPIFETRPSDMNTPRARAVEARQSSYESVCAEHDLFGKVTGGSASYRGHVYASNPQLYSSPSAPIRENTVSAHAAVYSAMPAEVFEQEAARERPHSAYRGDVYAANTELYDQVNFSLNKGTGTVGGYRNHVYAANPDMFSAKPKVEATSAPYPSSSLTHFVYVPANHADVSSRKTLVSSRGAVYMSAASRILMGAGSTVSGISPMTSPSHVCSPSASRRPMALTRTESQTSMKSSGSVSDLTALVHSSSTGMIRSSSSHDMQQLANVSLMSLSRDSIAEMEGEAFATTAAAPLSSRGLVRAGLGSLSAVSRLAKIGY